MRLLPDPRKVDLPTLRTAWWTLRVSRRARAQLAAGGPRELVIGVTSPRNGFRAHAWLEGDPPCHSEGYDELLRRGAT